MPAKSFKLPSWVSIALAAGLGVLGAVNVTALHLPNPWSELVTFLCVGAASLGISPLVHGALRNALHLSYPTAVAIAGLITSASAAVTSTKIDATLKGVLVGLLTAAAGVLAGPDSASSGTTPPKRPDG